MTMLHLKSTLTALIVSIVALPSLVFADVSVRPFLIDETVSPREILTTEVSLENPTSRKLTVYATVNEITVGLDGEVREFMSPIMSDRTNTVTSWIEITRGRIELLPGETKTIPVTFRIHPQAEPGEYHAFLGFVSTSKRHQAEAVALQGDADGVVVKLAIKESVREALRLKSFGVDRFILNPDTETVTISIENLGDTPIAPTGEIIFYRANGDELAAIPVTGDNTTTIEPATTKDITLPIPDGIGVGRVKANALLEYGSGRAALYDSTYFYSIPPLFLVALFAFSLVLVLLVILLMARSHRRDELPHEGEELPLYVRDGKAGKEHHHDIDLTKRDS